jgi:hypothetical protein
MEAIAGARPPSAARTLAICLLSVTCHVVTETKAIRARAQEAQQQEDHYFVCGSLISFKQYELSGLFRSSLIIDPARPLVSHSALSRVRVWVPGPPSLGIQS